VRFHIEIPSGAADILAVRHGEDDAAAVVTSHVRTMVREAVYDHVNALQAPDRKALRVARHEEADAAADGTLVAPEWVQPEGAHDAYEADAVVFHNGQFWVNTHGDGNVWEPGEVSEDIWAPLGDGE